MQLQATPSHSPMKCSLASEECINLQMKTEVKSSVLSDAQKMEDTNSSPIQGTYSTPCWDANLVVLSLSINNHLHYEVDKRAVLNFLMPFA